MAGGPWSSAVALVGGGMEGAGKLKAGGAKAPVVVDDEVIDSLAKKARKSELPENP